MSSFGDLISKVEKFCEQKQQPVPFPGRLGDRYYVLDGQVIEMPAPLANRDLSSLNALLEYAKTFVDSEDSSPQIWHDAGSVMLLPDSRDQRTRASFPLAWSSQFTMLQRLAAKPEPMEQRQFVKLLQVTLRCPAVLVTPWRKLDFKSQAQASGEVGFARDRMGREISAQVEGTADLPDKVPIEFPLYESEGERESYTIVCDVDVEAMAQRITLLPNALDLRDRVEQHQRSIRARIEEELPSIGVFAGSILCG
jgi:hypothetical protein